MKGGALAALKGNPWKKDVIQELGWREDAWGDEEWATGSANVKLPIQKKEARISASVNPWSVLNQESSSSSSVAAIKIDGSRKHSESSVITKLEPRDGGSNLGGQPAGNFDALEASDVVDDWEKACE